MNPRFPLVLVAPLLILLAGCETTGDPREGGLFGWSETMARDRQAARRAELAAVEKRVAREQRRSAQLAARKNVSDRDLAHADDELARSSAQLRMHEASVRAKAALLEQESPTAATASRARRLRMQVESVFSNRTLSAAERARQLGDLESQIDAARENVRR